MKFVDRKKYIIETAIGLQDVDHLRNSKYFLELADKYVDGKISLLELERCISIYYKSNSEVDKKIKEADFVSSRIALLLSKSDSFELSVTQLLSIHHYLFEDLLDHPGSLRTYNIEKSEWALNGESVVYGDYRTLYDTLTYDFETEKKINYHKLSREDGIANLAKFISNIWQDHPFEEGNTRSIAVFIILYLSELGLDIMNDTFANNAWYFRNALVRANYSNPDKNISSDKSFLIKFIRNLLKEDNVLNNDDLHINKIKKETPKESLYSEKEIILIDLLKDNPKIKIEEIAFSMSLSPRTIKSMIKVLREKNIIKRVYGKKYGYWETNK